MKIVGPLESFNNSKMVEIYKYIQYLVQLYVWVHSLEIFLKWFLFLVIKKKVYLFLKNVIGDQYMKLSIKWLISSSELLEEVNKHNYNYILIYVNWLKLILI